MQQYHPVVQRYAPFGNIRQDNGFPRLKRFAKPISRRWVACSDRLRQIFCDLLRPCSCSWQRREQTPLAGSTGISQKCRNKIG